MIITPEQKRYVIGLLRVGARSKAIMYFQDRLNTTWSQAKSLTEKLEDEILEQGALPFGKDKVGSLIGRWTGRGLMALGIIFILLGAYISYSNYKFSKTAIHVKGKIVEIKTHENYDNDTGFTTMYTFVFEYSLNGKMNRKTSASSSATPDGKVGDEINLLVDPDNSFEVLIDSNEKIWTAFYGLGFLGLMFIGMGYLAYRLID